MQASKMLDTAVRDLGWDGLVAEGSQSGRTESEVVIECEDQAGLSHICAGGQRGLNSLKIQADRMCPMNLFNSICVPEQQKGGFTESHDKYWDV